MSINVGCDGGMASSRAERLRQAIEMASGMNEHLEAPVTVSFGVAQRTLEMATLDDLIKGADEALYEAKNSGRNCVVLRDPPGPTSASA